MAAKGARICFGSYGIKALENGFITAKQIETIRVLLNRICGKTGNIWIRIFPDKPITRKPLGVRMGSGKGNVEYWAAPVKPGVILFEIDGVAENDIVKTANIVRDKLQIKVSLEKKRNVLYE
jgi:large subunit ribosomal protein L16